MLSKFRKALPSKDGLKIQKYPALFALMTNLFLLIQLLFIFREKWDQEDHQERMDVMV